MYRKREKGVSRTVEDNAERKQLLVGLIGQGEHAGQHEGGHPKARERNVKDHSQR